MTRGQEPKVIAVWCLVIAIGIIGLFVAVVTTA